MGRRPSKVKERMRNVTLGEIALCTIVEAELRFGVEKSDDPVRNLNTIEEFVARFVVFPFDSAAAKEYGVLRIYLERAATPIGRNDLLIAFIALAHGLILVTHNAAEFARVPRLVVEDWEV